MADIKRKLGTAGQTLTLTLASLANNAARQSTEVTNSTDLYLDALVMLKIKTGASGTSAASHVAIYAYSTVDDGTTRSENAGASDAPITLTDPPNVRFLGAINCPTVSTTYTGGPFSIARAFDGVLPARWGIVVMNRSGSTLSATEGDHAKLWQGVHLQTV